ncbi:MAG: Gfo/Idh/MocA family oxidoreductase [Opitutus sp.]
MSEKRFRIAFLGAGIAAEMHGRGLTRHGEAALAGVFDPDIGNAQNITSRFGGKVYRTEAELLDDSSVDAVYVLTPTELHVRQAAKALAAGRHVLIEKPVAMEVSEIDELEALATAHNRVCMPGHNYIYVPSLARGKRLIDAGKLGEIASVWVLYNILHSEALVRRYGGVLRAVCVHHIYSLLYLIGRPLSVVATSSNLHNKDLRCEDQVMMTCQMPNRAVANLWASFAASDPTNHPWSVAYKVLGTKGGFSYDWNEAQFDHPDGPAWGLPCYEDGFVGETAHFLDRCIGLDEPPLSTLSQARDSLRIIEAAERSLRTHRVEMISY